MNYSDICDYLSYDEVTGELTWLKDRGRMAKAGYKAGTTSQNGYIRVWFKGRSYPAHKIAWLLHNKEWCEYLDHIDGNRSNNKISNLRRSDPVSNAKNRKRPSNNTSGCTGVYSYPNGKWQARIHDSGKSIILGMFDDFESAKEARKAAEARHGYSKNHDRVISLD